MKNRGVLLFAFNNKFVRYTDMALFNKANIEKHYGCPVCIVSDKKVDDTTIVLDLGDDVTYRDYKGLGRATFKNSNRCNSFEITPFDETIIIDVDLFINSPSINKAWTGETFMMAKKAYDVLGRNLAPDVSVISNSSLSMYWATVICFIKDDFSKEFFKNWKDLVNNYEVYKRLFNFQGSLRNDFLVTLALYKTLDYKENYLVDLPISIPTAFEDTLVNYRNGRFFVNKGKEINFEIFSDIHVINKETITWC